MRTLHVFDHSLPLHSGYTFRSAALLREQARLGWETILLTSQKHERSGGNRQHLDHEDVEGRTFYRTNAGPSSLSAPVINELRLMRTLETRIRHLIEQHKHDLVHAHSPVLNAWPAMRAARAHGLPVVYEIRAFWEDAAVDQGTTTEGSLRYRATRAFETHVVRSVDHVFTICAGLERHLLDRGVPRNRISVVPNAVNVDDFSPQETPDPELRKRLGLDDALVLGFVGSFCGYVGLDLMIGAMPELLKVLPNARVPLVREGEKTAALKAQSESLGLGGKIVFTGRVPHAEVSRYYDLVDVLVLPRHRIRLTELVTPLKPLEAMAQCRLVLASDVGGHMELIADGETGYLFRSADAGSLVQKVVELARNRKDWARVLANGRRFVEERRTWRASAEAYVPVYQRLAGSKCR